MALPHVIIVPASGTAVQNGQSLATALTASSVATATSPILIQLDAGTYQVANTLIVPNYVSIKGEGMLLTSVQSTGTNLFSFGSTRVNNETTSLTNGLSDLTAGSSYAPVTSQSPGTFNFDHVHLTGNEIFFGLYTGGLFTAPIKVSVVNSILELQVNISTDQTNPAELIFLGVGSQINSIPLSSQRSVACFATYNASNVQYSTACQ